MYNDNHTDDEPVGRILGRREVLTLFGSAGALLLAAGGLRAVMADTIYLPVVTNNGEATPIPACVVSPQLTEGPYFIDEQLNRSDIRIDPSDNSVRAGAQLDLTLRVYLISNTSCAALAGAVVDIWHCDAASLYSDVQSEGTAGKKFLRGYQVSDTSGIVNFTTIYPGWYSGRAVHIHFKVRADLTSTPGYEFTSQFFFDDIYTDGVYTQQPYAARGTRNTRNSQDSIYQRGGSQLLLAVTESSGIYSATFDIGVAM